MNKQTTAIRYAIYAALVGLSWNAAAHGQNLGGFLEAHCFDCHDDATREAGLSLQSLDRDFDATATHRRWIRVHDQLAAGNMPPADHPQPSDEDRRTIVSVLREKLHDASLRHQQANGRVGLRRLNRTEYEYTLHDLLGVYCDLKEILPGDSMVAGFDTVSDGLPVSSVHLLRYQEAADKAIHEAFPWWPHPKDVPGLGAVDRQTPAKQAEAIFPYVMKRSAVKRGESLAYLANEDRHSSARTRDISRPGRYRIRASVAAEDTGGEPIHVFLGYVDKGDKERQRNEHILWVEDLEADSRRVIEFEATLPTNLSRVHIWGWNLPLHKSDAFLKRKGDRPIDQVEGPKLVVDWIELEGPLDDWPSIGYRRMFGDLPLTSRRILAGENTLRNKLHERVHDWVADPYIANSEKPKEDAARLIPRFLPWAFRRRVPEPSLVDYYVRFAHQRIDAGMDFDTAMKATYRAVLCSPFFLHRFEKPGPLDDYAIASRLSYFLWKSMPDEELFRLASAGRLRDRTVLREQVERMLKDRKSERFVTDFTDQWLDLRKIHMTTPNTIYYGEWDEQLLWSMPRETVLFFREILDHDRSLLEFVHSDWTMLNERLARHYGIPGVKGMEFRKVQLPADSHRGGVLTQAMILKVTADGTRTSPILRGVWVLDKIVGLPPSPPPPNLPAIEPDIRGATTIRQQLEKHRNTQVCATCHRHIDPPGFALETFDVIGGWRERYRSAPPPGGSGIGYDYVSLDRYPDVKTWMGLPVEKGYVTADGRSFEDVNQYKRILLEEKDQLARNLVEKLVIYSTGAEIAFADREVTEQIVAKTRENNYGFRTLIHEIVQSRLFLNK